MLFRSSGTITLEHAIIGTPCIVGYRFMSLSYWFAKLLFAKKIARIKYMSLPNLLANSMVIPEFFQSCFQVEHLYKTALHYLCDDRVYQQYKQRIISFSDSLGSGGAISSAANKLEGML